MSSVHLYFTTVLQYLRHIFFLPRLTGNFSGKTECSVFVREIFLCGCVFSSWKINETCLLCSVVRASRLNLYQLKSLVLTLSLCLLVIQCRLSKARPLKSTLPLQLSLISFNKLRSSVKYCFYYSKINFYVFAPSSYILRNFVRTIIVEKTNCVIILQSLKLRDLPVPSLAWWKVNEREGDKLLWGFCWTISKV